MDRAIRSIACALAFSASIIAAGLAAGGGDQGYFVVLLGLVGSVVFGLLLIRLIAGTASFNPVLEYLFASRPSTDDD